MCIRSSQKSSRVMPKNSIAHLAVAGVTALITFLAYGSQILFWHIKPAPLDGADAYAFNALVCCIWVTYLRACFTDPGRAPSSAELSNPSNPGNSEDELTRRQRQRWCKRCNAVKPPRAHHCKSCARYDAQSGFNLCFGTQSDPRSTDVYRRWITIVLGQ